MTGDLWCKVFYSKFGGNKDLQFAINSQPYESPLLKALAGVWDHFDQHIVWQIGDGHRINLWMDIWVSNGSLLMPTTTNQLIDSTLMVKDVLTSERKLDLKFLYNNLPRNIVNQVVALHAPKERDCPDLVGWGGTNTRHFTFKSVNDWQKGNANRI
ncbi:hypothetical protein QL285_019552 [Trifolium repens]|nr:hypothetical protein QL285_019552 [Trifolium repens]